MMTRRRFLTLLGVGAVAGTGAVGGAVLLRTEDRADAALPTIRYGAESCVHCSMIIDDRRFAAAWTAPGGASGHFDDIGCAVANEERESLPTGARRWVADYETYAWLDATTATYVVSDEIRSPMAYGVAALSTADAAERLGARVSGMVVAWDVLPDHLERGHH